MNSIGLLGNGAQAKEIAGFCEEEGFGVAFNAVQARYMNGQQNLIDIENPNDELLKKSVIAAVGSTALKRVMIELWPGEAYGKLVSVKSWVSKHANIGEGSVIAPKAAISREVQIGKHVLVNLGSTLSHDVNVGDFATIAPGVNIAGGVTIGEGAFLGIGSTLKNGINLAPGVVVGAGAVVIHDIEQENAVFAGNPAKLIRVNKGWINEI